MALRISKEKYKDRLTLRGISNKALAEAAGITPTTLSRAINAKSYPTPETVGKIARALNCTPADLLEEVSDQ